MPNDGTSLTKDDIEVFRKALDGLYDNESHPIEFSLSNGIYAGFYPSGADSSDELGVSYIYIADPSHHFDTPAPQWLSDAPDTLRTVAHRLRAVLCDITGYSYRFSRRDEGKGGIHYGAVLRRRPHATAQQRES